MSRYVSMYYYASYIEIQYYKIRISYLYSHVKTKMTTVPLAQTKYLPTYIVTAHT